MLYKLQKSHNLSEKSQLQTFFLNYFYPFSGQQCLSNGKQTLAELSINKIDVWIV